MLLLISPLRALTFGEVEFNYKNKLIIALDALLITMILVGFIILNIGGGRFVATIFLEKELVSYNQFQVFTSYIVPYFFVFGVGLQAALPLCMESSFFKTLHALEPSWFFQICKYTKSIIKFCVTVLCLSGCAELFPAEFLWLKKHILLPFLIGLFFALILTFLLRMVYLTQVHRIWLAILGFILMFIVLQRVQENLISGRVFKIDFSKSCV